jgi:tetratricopeptide (TPR) repeat protein
MLTWLALDFQCPPGHVRCQRAASLMRCLDDDTIVDYLEGALTSTAAAAVEQHVAGCRQCRKLISAAVQTGPLPGEPHTPAPLSQVSPSAGLGPAEDHALPPLRRGDSLGRYHIRDLLGTGGMSIVYVAHDPDLDREVALKILRRHTDAAARAWLLREARALARISHRNVIAVHDVGVHDDHVYIAMERVDGITLAAWLRQTRPWREIVAVFAAAGRGLAAAHAAGVVHRDFKPDNVLIGAGDEARVLDFGLARVAEAAGDGLHHGSVASHGAPAAPGALPPAFPDAPSAISRARLLGTPRYMAPEQFRGADIGPAADQFSFCVALYEALYAQRAFDGDSVSALASEVLAGRIQPVPAKSPVPAALRAVLWRGLAVDPAARHASMDALLAALHRSVYARRRRWIAGGALAAAGAIATLLAARPTQPAAVTCEPAERALAGVWDRGRKDAIAAAFAATGLPYASDALGRVAHRLDDYAARWGAMYDEACAAARAEPGPRAGADTLPDLRVHCLDGRLQRLRALVEVYAAADAGTVERAVQAVETLPPVAFCASAESQRSAPVPADIEQRTAVERVRAEIARVAALYNTGKYAEGLHAAAAAVDAAAATAYRPVMAEALYHRGALEHTLGRHQDAETSLFDAASTAQAAGHDRQAAVAYVALHDLVAGSELRFEDGKRWEALAAAVIERLGGDAELEMRLARNRAGVALERGDLDAARAELARALALEQSRDQPSQIQLAGLHSDLGNVATRSSLHEQALQHYRDSLRLLEQAVGPDYPEIAVLRNNMGSALRSMGRYQESLDVLEQAMPVAERVFGAEHELTAALCNNIGAALSLLERHDEALRYLERGVAIAEAFYGREHPHVGENLVNLGHELTVMGRYQDAVAGLERALAIAAAWQGGTPAYATMARINLANALLALGRHVEARAHYERAVDEAARTMSPRGPEVAEALVGLGQSALAAGAPAQALAPLERALAIHAEALTEPMEHARTRFVLAQALWESSRDRPRALLLAREALAAYDASGLRPAERSQVAAWLARRARGSR